MKFVFSLSLSLLFCCHVAADTISTYTLFGVDIQLAQMKKDTAISVVTSDQVSDGCWTSGQASESALQRELIDADTQILLKNHHLGQASLLPQSATPLTNILVLFQ